MSQCVCVYDKELLMGLTVRHPNTHTIEKKVNNHFLDEGFSSYKRIVKL